MVSIEMLLIPTVCKDIIPEAFCIGALEKYMVSVFFRAVTKLALRVDIGASFM